MSTIKSNINNSNNSNNAEATATTLATQMLTPEEVVEQLRAIRARIPEFVQLPKSRVTDGMRRKARINVVFAREAFGLVGASDVVQGVVGNSPDELHRAEDEKARWSAVESELQAMWSGVATANVVRGDRIAQVALQAYNVGTQLVKQTDYAYLLPHVERMKRLPKYGRRRVKPAAEAQPVPTPGTTPVPKTQLG